MQRPFPLHKALPFARIWNAGLMHVAFTDCIYFVFGVVPKMARGPCIPIPDKDGVQHWGYLCPCPGCSCSATSLLLAGACPAVCPAGCMGGQRDVAISLGLLRVCPDECLLTVVCAFA